MKLVKLIKHDIFQCMIKIICVSVSISLLVILFAYDYSDFIVQLEKYDMFSGMASYMDYIARFFSGDVEYELSATSEFTLPIDWMAFNCLIAYVVGFHTHDDMLSYGKYCIVYSNSKTKWLIAKMIYRIGLVFWCYFIAYLTMAVCTCYLNVGLNTNMTVELWENVVNLRDNNILLYVVVIPIMTSLVISSIQLFLELQFSPIIAFLTIVLMFVIGVYKMNYFLLGNYTMWYRSAMGCENGLEAGRELIILMITFLIFTYLSWRCFKQRDIIDNYENI